MHLRRLPFLLVNKILALLNGILGGILDPILGQSAGQNTQKGIF